MSKRFGRNQRHRAREALATEQANSKQRIGELVSVLEMARTDLIEKGHRLREADDFARDVARAVGRSCVYAGVALPQSFSMDRYEAAKYGMRVVSPQEFRGIEEFSNTMNVEQVRFEVVRLLDIQAVRDKLRSQMHFRVQLADNVVGYAISESALSFMTHKELERILVMEITEEIARALSTEIKKKFNN